MIRLIDTSYIIVFDKEENRLTAYYDLRGKLDNHSTLMSNLATVGNYGCIANLFDMSKDEMNDELVKIFKENWSRFLLIKSLPLNDSGLTLEQTKDILKKEVEGYLINNHLSDLWR